MARLRRKFFRLIILLIPIVFLISICLYLTMSSNVTDNIFKSKILSENKFISLAKEIEDNGIIINALKKETNDLFTSEKLISSAKIKEVEKVTHESKMISREQNVEILSNLNNDWCLRYPQLPINNLKSKENHINMLDLYDTLSFDNPDGGVWKQGFDITYDATKDWSQQNQLNVYVVPHSHDDPGWIKTYTDYYETETKYIFENMVNYLAKEPRMKFIYAEISFFSLWWNATTPQNRLLVKKLVSEGRLEFVTGGWVMNDEANAHYYAMVDQMIEGNQWLEKQLGVKPEIGWFIDPFGHSSANAYLVKKAGLKGLLIQRVHYSIKKHFARSRSLEFSWRQPWDHRGDNDVLCHMMPFYSYDIPHTCGPDPKVCCQFDFNRLRGSSVGCPWGVPAEAITDANLNSRAELLLDQYRKKGKLYRTNHVLIPLGDDFRYKTSQEWDNQVSNYLKLFGHLNSLPGYNVKVKFATLSEYFSAVQAHPERPAMPVVTGDFFTYADRDDHYWSGYYVSRPQYKRMDRILESKLRSAEIFYSYALARARTSPDKWLVDKLAEPDVIGDLVSARRNLALFQHHDGITGTAKTVVVNDYAKRMLDAIKKSDRILSLAVSCLSSLVGVEAKPAPLNNTLLKVKESSPTKRYDPSYAPPPVFDPRYSYGPENLIRLISGSTDRETVHIVNSLAQGREDIVSLFVDTVNVCLKNDRGQPVKAQINPVLNNPKASNMAQTEIYEVVFEIKMDPLSVAPITLYLVEAQTCPSTVLAEISVSNSYDEGQIEQLKSKFKVQDNRKAPNSVNPNVHQGTFVLENKHQTLVFDSQTGLLRVVKGSNQPPQKVAIQFAYYETSKRPETSGAYLFIPEGPARNVTIKGESSKILTWHGPIVSRVVADLTYAYEDSKPDQLLHLVHRLTIRHTDDAQQGGAILIENDIDMRAAVNDNKEIVMRLETDIVNPNGEFYTDLNGFQIQKRRYLPKLPIQANFYPIPTTAFLEDGRRRLTLLTGQPLGAASLYQGALEVIMDRRLAQDDNRGLFQTVQDNEPMTNRFAVSVESVANEPRVDVMPWTSSWATTLSLQLLHPLAALRRVPNPKDGSEMLEIPVPVALITAPLPANVHLVNAKTLLAQSGSPGVGVELIAPSKEIGITFHTMGFDCRFGSVKGTTLQDGGYLHEIETNQLLPGVEVKEVREMALSFTHDLTPGQSSSKGTKPFKARLKPMELQAFKVTTE